VAKKTEKIVSQCHEPSPRVATRTKLKFMILLIVDNNWIHKIKKIISLMYLFSYNQDIFDTFFKKKRLYLILIYDTLKKPPCIIRLVLLKEKQLIGMTLNICEENPNIPRN